jgi:hypothetical protein
VILKGSRNRGEQGTIGEPDSSPFVSPTVTGGIFVPARFGKQIATHLILNLLDPPGLTVPLMLTVHGAAGEGKTLQCQKVFEAMGVEAVWPPAEAFESRAAGEAQRILLEAYRETAEVNAEIEASWERGIQEPPYLKIMFINDLDQRIGRRDGAIQQTVNTQLVNASLMELADNPTTVSGQLVERVPIVITANDLTSVHAPLCRDGRMRRFEWIPSHAERAEILAAMYPETELTVERAAALMNVAGYSPKQPNRDTPPAPSTAMFAAMRLILFEKAAQHMLDRFGVANVLGAIRCGEVDHSDLQPDLSFQSLTGALEELRNSSLLSNHLHEG